MSATLEEIRNWPPTIDVTTAARVLGISRSSAYELVKVGQFPVRTLRVGSRVRVLTHDLVRVLSGGEAA
jgi:predicted DNA-binding transcriptional regulator AlpA